ncbi:hypothetical protein L208DRAFT_1216552, partial [Tricholoma matsutake]
DANMLSMFQPLTKDDLKASTAILKPNAPGSTNLHLSWIWHKPHLVLMLLPMVADSGNVLHWLRSWAQRNRWKEGLLLVTYKMQWTMRYFMYHSQKWRSALISDNTPPGSLAYAHRQQAVWYNLAFRADKAFRS